jgi:hypothetical protein
LSALAERGELAFNDPIVITHERFVIDGYARWELAKRRGRALMNCIEHHMTSEEALEQLIRAHGPSRGLADFLRIELALDMEPHFREKALMNQQAGGQYKGSSKLTRAQQIDTRREIARLAGVGSGNVHKVKKILAHACSSLLQAARTGEVSINLADKWSHKPHTQQNEYLRLSRIERGIEKKARGFVAAHLARLPRYQRLIKLPELVELLKEADSIDIEILDAPGMRIFITEELIDALTQRRVEHV